MRHDGASDQRGAVHRRSANVVLALVPEQRIKAACEGIHSFSLPVETEAITVS